MDPFYAFDSDREIRTESRERFINYLKSLMTEDLEMVLEEIQEELAARAVRK